MPDQFKLQTHTQITATNRRRITRVETHRHLHTEEFSYAGALTISTSGPWVHHQDCSLIEVRALLGTAGTSSTVVTVYANAVSVGTVTLASSVVNNAATLSTALTANTDVVTVGVTTAGTGAKDLTVLLRVA